MLNRKTALILGVLAIGGMLVLGLIRVFTLRFQHGDVYPPYSTLRADPLGAKVLYDALDGVDGFSLQRNYESITRRRPGAPMGIIYAGVARKSIWGEDELKAFEALVTNGGRAVFAFAPEDLNQFRSAPPVIPTRKATGKKKTAQSPTPSPTPTPAPAATPAPNPAATPVTPVSDDPLDDADDDETEGLRFSEVLDRWGAAFALPKGRAGTDYEREAKATDEAEQLESQLSWHTSLFFKDLNTHWKTLYTCGGKPVVIERKFGDGTIVLTADAYHLSNEALRDERRPRLLSWLIGPPRLVIFDEEHHGVTENANIATLSRKYRLEGVLATLGFIAALFVWKHAVPLLPKRRDLQIDSGEVRGKDAEEGFINLLRRSIPRGQVLKVCVEEWEKTCGHRARPAESAHVQSVLRAHEARSARDPVAAYRSIAEGLQKRNPKQ